MADPATEEGTPTPSPAPAPSVQQTGGTQSVQFEGDAAARAQEEANRNNQQQAEPQRPEGLPEGFDSWEDYGKAVSAGEINPDGSKIEASKAEGGEEAEALSSEQQAEVDAALQDLPEDRREVAKPFFEEYARTGDISPESRKEAAKAFGVTEAMVDAYVKGAQASDTESATTIIEAAGETQSDFDAFREWANDGGYTAEQQQAFNDQLAKDPSQAIRDAMKDWRESGNGPAARDITKGERQPPANNQAGPEPYASTSEMTRDMQDPRYSKDPAFRAKVEARVGVTDFNNARKTK